MPGKAGRRAQSARTAMASTSTLKPPGKAATGTMARAGLYRPAVGLGQVDRDLGHLLQRGAAGFEHGAQVGQALVDLRFQVGMGQRAAIRGDGDLPRHEQQLAGADAGAVGAARRRTAGRLDRPQRLHRPKAQRMASGAPIEPVAPTIGTGL
ncbi:MAG: hypothetical protein MUF16_24835 [Burkholderiaceae bacterium]|nr:hypothetical protein [Burkholderiaceae bacterium]